VLAFRSGPPPKGFKKDFESFLFNTREHRLTQARTGWREFYLLNKERNKILALVAFCVQNKKASSPLRAPFGSFEISVNLKLSDLKEFIIEVEKALVKAGVSKIEIINPPALYSTYHNRLVAALLNQNYTPIQCDLSCSIPVDQTPLLEKINKGKRKQLRHGQKAGFTFKKLTLSKLNDVYVFIESCRLERSQKLSLSLKELQRTVNVIPKAFQLFAVYQNNRIISASVCVQINKSILYTFYSAHLKVFDNFSPLVFLLSHLYDLCHKKGISLLDMGTSTIGGKPNFNLIDFKIRVGGILSPKFIFIKELKG